ncbi:hypothetical protein C404_06515 [Ralstonia sp. AU12-08]|nr:hypothetical protein C404_06515 [Ralstonia sp. AU12-08]
MTNPRLAKSQQQGSAIFGDLLREDSAKPQLKDLRSYRTALPKSYVVLHGQKQDGDNVGLAQFDRAIRVRVLLGACLKKFRHGSLM